MALFLSSAAVLLAGCSSTQDGVDSAPPATSGDSNILKTPIRSPQDPILGQVSPEGSCDETVIGIDHNRPTAHITYKGQPGDKIKVEIRYNSPEKTPTIQSFELGSMQTEMQLPTGIENSSISNIKVTAEGRVGAPGECTIEVE